MEDLLFLAHRIPYPPNKGDKIRSFHLLRQFSRFYRVHLGAFVDDPDDWRHETAVREMCADVCLIPLNSNLAKLHALSALVDRAPLSLAYFRNRRLNRWVRSLLTGQQVRRVFVYSSSMAQYVLPELPLPGVRCVLDFVDVDSDKWLQYGSRRGWPLSALYNREGRMLERFEREAAAAFDASVFVSEAEAELFRRIAPDSAENISCVENGVDSLFFSPDREYPDPYSGNQSVFVFTGAMDYWANIDAVKWFATEIFPLVRDEHGDARFFIVGARPSREVLRLSRSDGSVVVTGRVEDVRPFLSHARAAVAPLRIARGVQNKVLEAMAMAKPVVASPQALEGITLDAAYPLVAEHPRDWFDRISALVKGEIDDDLGKRLRAWIEVRYAWESRLPRFVELLGDTGAAKA